MTRRTALGSAWVCVLLLGCADNLVFATRTSLGIKIKPVQENQSEVSLGYDRQELAIFPVPQVEGEGPEGGAYRLWGRFFMVNRWPLVDSIRNSGLRIHSMIATGDAAACVAEIVVEEPEACEEDPP